MLPRIAMANSAPTNHQKSGGMGSWLDNACAIRSMMSFVIHNAANGVSELTSRKTNPRETTRGPDSQTIRRTGGTFRSAANRSRQPPQKFSRSAILRPLGQRVDGQRVD